MHYIKDALRYYLPRVALMVMLIFGVFIALGLLGGSSAPAHAHPTPTPVQNNSQCRSPLVAIGGQCVLPPTMPSPYVPRSP